MPMKVAMLATIKAQMRMQSVMAAQSHRHLLLSLWYALEGGGLSQDVGWVSGMTSMFGALCSQARWFSAFHELGCGLSECQPPSYC